MSLHCTSLLRRPLGSVVSAPYPCHRSSRRCVTRWPISSPSDPCRHVRLKAQQQDDKPTEAAPQTNTSSPTTGQANQGDDTFTTKAAQWAAEAVASPVFYLVAGLLAIKLVSSTGEQASSILVFAALPITALTALSKSSLGKQVQAQLEAKLPTLEAEANALKASHEQARQRSKWFGPNRPRLPGPLGSASHLTGQVAGDVGFDPLGLSKEAAAFDKYYEAELLHARWAMLGAIGVLIPEALSISGVSLGEAVWWKVGAAKLNDDLTLNWGGIEGFRIAGKQGIGIIAACQLVLMGGPEYARYVGIRSLEPVGVFLPGTTNYPGGVPFDPLGFSSKPDEFIDQTVKEIKHGRMAMVAMLAYAVQALVTRDGPVQNLLDFLADPGHNNLVGRLGN